MADIHDLFKKFNNEISLSTDKQNNLRKGRDALRSKIKTWFTDHDKQQPTFCWQGSFAMKTTVNPINGNEYDLPYILMNSPTLIFLRCLILARILIYVPLISQRSYQTLNHRLNYFLPLL